MSEKTCFQIAPDDNVAVVLEDALKGETLAVIGSSGGTVTLLEDIEYGHKVALQPIQHGNPIIKYGITIGKATQDIAIGDNVHLHNCASAFDERSSTFDHQTGATTDTIYE